MRIVFMGTPRFAGEVLQNLSEQHEICAVYTRADAVSGRGKRLVPSPVKQIAQAQGIPVETVPSLKDAEVQQSIRALNPDAICVAAYGVILPKEVLEIPRFGCLNVHTSLLPRWRGAAPVQRAILAGDEEAGVCIMRMEEGLDTGDYCVCRTTAIDDKSYIALTDELASLGSAALLTALEMLDSGTVEWVAQDETQITYASKIGKGELFIAPEMKVAAVKLAVQASSPAHPSRCVIASRSVTVLDARKVEPFDAIHEKLRLLHPGRIMLVERRLFLGCVDGPIEVLAVRPDGKKTMDAQAFAAGVQNVKSGLITWEGHPLNR